MNIRDEISKYSQEEEKPILLFLFSRYHMASNWHFVAKCTFEGIYPNARRIWTPTEEGRILFSHYSK